VPHHENRPRVGQDGVPHLVLLTVSEVTLDLDREAPGDWGGSVQFTAALRRLGRMRGDDPLGRTGLLMPRRRQMRHQSSQGTSAHPPANGQ